MNTASTLCYVFSGIAIYYTIFQGITTMFMFTGGMLMLGLLTNAIEPLGNYSLSKRKKEAIQ